MRRNRQQIYSRKLENNQEDVNKAMHEPTINKQEKIQKPPREPGAEKTTAELETSLQECWRWEKDPATLKSGPKQLHPKNSKQSDNVDAPQPMRGVSASSSLIGRDMGRELCLEKWWLETLQIWCNFSQLQEALEQGLPALRHYNQIIESQT